MRPETSFPTLTLNRTLIGGPLPALPDPGAQPQPSVCHPRWKQARPEHSLLTLSLILVCGLLPGRWEPYATPPRPPRSRSAVCPSEEESEDFDEVVLATQVTDLTQPYSALPYSTLPYPTLPFSTLPYPTRP